MIITHFMETGKLITLILFVVVNSCIFVLL